MVRRSRAAAVKDGRILRPPGGLVLDCREHDGRLVCVGIDRRRVMPALVVDRREISDRGMAAPIVEAFDERERRIARLGLRLEAVPREKLAFEGGEEALAHGIVVCVADRTHRGAHARVTAAVTELDRGVLRTLVGVMDHACGSPRQKRQVQSVKYQLRGERGGHRPADNAATVRIEHHGEIEKPRPGRDVGDVGDPEPIRRFRREIALDQVRRLSATILHRGGDEPASAHTGETGLRHQSRHPLAPNISTLGRELGMNAWRTVGTVRALTADTGDCHGPTGRDYAA